MDPYSKNSRKMSYRKPAPIYVPTPPASPPQAMRASVRYSIAEAALDLNLPHDWRFTAASVASESTASFPTSDDESTYELPWAPTPTRGAKPQLHRQNTRRAISSLRSPPPPPLKGRGAHYVYHPPTPPLATHSKPLPATRERHTSVQSSLYPVLPTTSKALPNVPIFAEQPPWEESTPLSLSPKLVPLSVSDVHREHIPLPPSQVMLPAIPANVRQSSMPSKKWTEGSTCTWDSEWQDLPSLKQCDRSYSSSQRKFDKPRSTASASSSILGRIGAKLGSCISEINLC